MAHAGMRKSVRLFQNDFLEWFTHVHPAIPLLLWGPIALGLLWTSLVMYHTSPTQFLVCGFSGLFAWTFLEYLLHRYFFHWEPKNKAMNYLIQLFHGVHHETPNDPTRLVMPPVVSILLGIILFALINLLLPAQWGLPFFAFIVLGYLFYDYIHYFTHHFPAKGPIGKYLKVHHMKHHFTDPNTRFGVSSPLWDWVFGT